MTAKTIEELAGEIERLVREHLVAQREAVTMAVERAFAGTTQSRTPKTKTKPSSTASSIHSWGRRRDDSELASLSERLLAAVRANPGATMAEIAPQIGEHPRALHRPMLHLKRAGRVRSAGQRFMTRYFPMTPRS